jgi:REP element-mobilizing transposase RayT
MVAAYHLIWTAYGCWLANDPRGSSSHELRVDKFVPLGEVHLGRKEQQPPSSTLRAFYREADELLEHRRLLFDDTEVAVIATRFSQTIRERGYICHACAILPDHVHLVVRRHPDRAEGIIDFLQQDSKQALIAAQRRPVNHPVWGGPGWKVFLNTRAEIEGRIRYVAANPRKAGLPDQPWDFVTAYDGWLPRLGDA